MVLDVVLSVCGVVVEFNVVVDIVVLCTGSIVVLIVVLIVVISLVVAGGDGETVVA